MWTPDLADPRFHVRLREGSRPEGTNKASETTFLEKMTVFSSRHGALFGMYMCAAAIDGSRLDSVVGMSLRCLQCLFFPFFLSSFLLV